MRDLAIFDFCDTLVSFQTADRFVDFVHANHIGLNSLLTKQLHLANRLKVFSVLNRITPGNGLYKKVKLFSLKGISQSSLNTLAEKYYYEQIRKSLHLPVIAKLRHHQDKNDDVIISSGGYDIYIQYFCKEFNVPLFHASALKFDSGLFTGLISGRDCMREEKVKRLRSSIGDLSEYDNVFVYSDSLTDVPLFNIADYPYVVHAGDLPGWAIQNDYLSFSV